MSELADRPLRVPGEPIVLHWWRLFRWFANLRLVPRWREAKPGILVRAIRRYFYDAFTRPGKVVFICSILIFLFSYRSRSEFLLASAAFGAAILTWSAILAFVHRPRVTVSRSGQATATAGEAHTSLIRLHNDSRFTLYNFVVREMVIPYGKWPGEWELPHHAALAAGGEVTVPVTFEPRKRGVMQLSGVAIQSYYPFFLTRFTRRIPDPVDLYVLPQRFESPVPSLRHIADQASKKMKSGSDNSRKGPSLEYSFSRQYQLGDSLRRLDHRASSRLSRPMSKVFEGTEEIRRDKVYIMVDLTLRDFLAWHRRPIDDSPLDQRLALAVEVGLSSQNEGFSLVALAAGTEWHQVDSVEAFYREIASCTPQRALDGSQPSLPGQLLNDDGLHILVTGRWSEQARDLHARCQAQGILLLVMLVPEAPQDAGALPVGAQFIEFPASHNASRSRFSLKGKSQQRGPALAGAAEVTA